MKRPVSVSLLVRWSVLGVKIYERSITAPDYGGQVVRYAAVVGHLISLVKN